MAGKTGKGIADIYRNIQSEFSTWKTKSGNLLRALKQGDSVSADILFSSVYHDARRSLDVIDTVASRVVDKGWASTLRKYGQDQLGADYDVLTEASALRAHLVSLQGSAVEALGGVDEDGYLTLPYARLANAGPYFRQVSKTDLADVVLILEAIDSDIDSD